MLNMCEKNITITSEVKKMFKYITVSAEKSISDRPRKKNQT